MSARLAKRRLVEPDYWTCPHGVRVRPDPALTYGPEVADLCDQAGYTPDPQQELGLDLVFAIRSDGSPASFSGCVICARQNLKSGLFLQCVIGWLFVLDDVPEIAWSAHELRTSLNAQEELFRILESPVLSKYLPATPNAGKYDTNGKERQELTTGQTVWFQTRTRDGGRGLGKPKLILDEAFKLKSRMVGALLPILLAQHHPQMLYGSSAPPLDPDAEVLRDVMDRGRNHKSPELWYLEWLADREECAESDCRHPKDALTRGLDCALDREHLILQANPTVDRDRAGRALDTGRITLRTLRALRQELPPDEYMRECLGWPEVAPSAASLSIFPNWSDGTGEPLEKPEAPAAIGIAVSVSRAWASIAAGSLVEVLENASDPESEPVEVSYVAPVDRREGTSWLVAEVKRIQDATDCIAVMDAKGPGKSLIKDFEEADVALELVEIDDVAEGTARFADKVRDTRLLHPLAPELDDAVEAAVWRYYNDRPLVGRRQSGGEVDMLEAAILADYGAGKFGDITLG